MSRRAWLPHCARTIMMSAMAVFGGIQYYKSRRLANDPNCIKLNTCQDCIEFGGCNLNKATSFRASKAHSKPAKS